MFSDPQHIIEQLGLEPGSRVADFGTGSGFYSFAAAQAVSQAGKVYALDVQKELLSKIKTEASRLRLTNIEPVWADLDGPRSSTLKDNSCDAVIAANVLFQVENKDQFLKEAHRILKPRGKLLIVDWSDSFGGLGPSPLHIFTEDQAKGLVEAHNFTIEKVINAGAHHYGFIARKA